MPARIVMLIYALSKLSQGSIHAPKSVLKFWKGSSAVQKIARDPEMVERIRTGMDRSRQIAQRALLHAVGETKERYARRWHFLAPKSHKQPNKNTTGLLHHFFQEVMSPWLVPDFYVDTDTMIRWKPHEDIDPLEEAANIGFGGAISVLTAVLSNGSDNNNGYGLEYSSVRLKDKAQAFSFARTPRSRARCQYIEFPPSLNN
jgi:hypothetical protein